MGFAYTNAVWEMKPIQGMSSGTWNVLLSLADMANSRDGKCWPSMAVIAARAKLQEQQARIHVHRLEKLGLIQIIKNRNGGPPGSTLRIRMLFGPSSNHETPPFGGSPLSQPIFSNPSLQREPTPTGKRTDGSLQVLKTPPAQGSQTIMNRRDNLLEKIRIRYLETGRFVLDGYREVAIAARELDLTLGEHNQLESTGEFAKRVRTEIEKFLKSDGRHPP
jgi:hypothetical protein